MGSRVTLYDDGGYLQQMGTSKRNRIAKELYPHALLWQDFTRPAGMVRVVHIGFWVWHESEDAAAGVAYCRNIAH